MIVRSLQLHKSVKQSCYRGVREIRTNPSAYTNINYLDFPPFSISMSVKFLTVMKAMDEMHSLWDFMQD